MPSWGTRYFELSSDGFTMVPSIPHHHKRLIPRKRRPTTRHPCPSCGTHLEQFCLVFDCAIEGPFDFVSLLVGVNNQYRERGIDEYRQQFRDLVGRAIEFADGVASRVLVVPIPDWSVTPFADRRDRENISSEIDRFNEVNREEARSVGSSYADLTPLSRTQGNMVVGDGLHPSGQAYAAWVELVLPVAWAQL